MAKDGPEFFFLPPQTGKLNSNTKRTNLYWTYAGYTWITDEANWAKSSTFYGLLAPKADGPKNLPNLNWCGRVMAFPHHSSGKSVPFIVPSHGYKSWKASVQPVMGDYLKISDGTVGFQSAYTLPVLPVGAHEAKLINAAYADGHAKTFSFPLLQSKYYYKHPVIPTAFGIRQVTLPPDADW